jgi:predicted nucleic acid-binding protein
LPAVPEPLVVNTGPLIALGRVDAFDFIQRLPLRFISPTQVASEIAAGVRLGHPVTMPPWVEVIAVSAPLSAVSVSALDEGEAAVIQLAVELGIERVCIDEWRGRRAATAAGLKVTGSLGLVGRAKSLGLIAAVRPWIKKMDDVGIHYHPELLEKFLSAIGE